MKKFLLFLCLFLFVLSPSLKAQDDETEKEQIRNKITNLEDESEKSKKKKAWLSAIDNYKKIRDLLKVHTDVYPRDIFEEKRRDTLYELGYCYLQGAESNQGDQKTFLKAAKKNLDDMLRLSASQGEAYFYLAKIFSIYYKEKGEATKEGKALYEEVKKYMKLSAENGYNVFVGIEENQGLKFLKNDAQFIMTILKTSKKIDFNEVHKLPDPFKPKFDLYIQIKGPNDSGDTGGIQPPTLGAEGFGQNKDQQEKLLKDIEKTFNQLKNMVNKAGVMEDPKPEVIQLWQRLQQLLKQKDDIFIPKLSKKLAEILKNLSEMQERLEKVQLAYYYSQGKNILENMRKSFAIRNYPKVITHWNELRELAREMAKSGNEDFRKTAESLLNSGQNFEKQAQTYIQLARIKHEVTGIIIELYPVKKRVAIVNDRLYIEGDFILNDKGEPMELKIKKIESGKVTFVYKGVEVPEFLRD